VDGSFSALIGWRAVANHLVQLPDNQARQEAAAVLQSVPQQLRSASEPVGPTRWMANPTGLHRVCTAAIHRLLVLPAGTPSPRRLPIRRRTCWPG
jgi:ABC-type phosphate transport system permease subunit